MSAPKLPDDAHAFSEALVFLEHVPGDRQRSAAVAARVHKQLSGASHFRADPDETSYGLSPLALAPLADSRWRRLFGDEDMLAAHLDQLTAGPTGRRRMADRLGAAERGGCARMAGRRRPGRFAHPRLLRAIERTSLAGQWPTLHDRPFWA